MFKLYIMHTWKRPVRLYRLSNENYFLVSKLVIYKNLKNTRIYYLLDIVQKHFFFHTGHCSQNLTVMAQREIMLFPLMTHQ